MDAADLKIFEAVARLGSMSRASEELHTVQSNVTSRIQALEHELGIKLLFRTNRGVCLTPAGKRLLPFTTQISQLLSEARQAVLDEGTPAGQLVIGTLETTAAMRLSPIIAKYTTTYQDVDLTLRTGTTCELIDQVIARQLDGAFVCGPVNHAALTEEVVFEEELVVLTAPGIKNLAAYLRKPNLKIIVLRAGCSYRLVLESLLARRGIVGFKTLEFGTLETIFSTVSAGLGLTLFPRRLIGSACSERRVALHSLRGDEGMVETVFIRRHDSYASSALLRFLDMARLLRDADHAAAEYANISR